MLTSIRRNIYLVKYQVHSSLHAGRSADAPKSSSRRLHFLIVNLKKINNN